MTPGQRRPSLGGGCEDGPVEHPPGSTAAQRERLAMSLALASGAMDVIAFTRLGHVFASVITGNVALLGLAAGTRDGTLAVHTGVSLAGYALGAALVSRLAARPAPRLSAWPRPVSVVLGLELVALLALALLWELARGGPGGALQLLLLALGAGAMGMQSVAVVRLAIPGFSSTYMTGTLTTSVMALVQGRDRPLVRRGALALGVLLLGALVGGLLSTELEWAAPLWPLLVVASVLGLGLRLDSRPGRAPELSPGAAPGTGSGPPSSPRG